jgi:hypothetical protein
VTHVNLLLLNLPGYSVRGCHKLVIAAVMHPQTQGFRFASEPEVSDIVCG